MLQISPEQMEALRAVPREVFATAMVSHLKAFSPALAQTLSEPQLRTAVDFAMAQAYRHGLTHRGPVQLYIEVALLFGSHFDSDPQYPWAASALGDTDRAQQMDRAKRLYTDAMAYRHRVAGPDDAWSIAALRRLDAFAVQPVSLRPGHYVTDLQGQLAQIYPEKADYLGEEATYTLIQSGASLAQRHGFTSVQAVAMLVILMFSFGHGCLSDPLYPWIAATLRDQRLPSPEARAARLEKKARTWLTHVLLHFSVATRGSTT